MIKIICARYSQTTRSWSGVFNLELQVLDLSILKSWALSPWSWALGLGLQLLSIGLGSGWSI